jgi:hypothetical protein
VQLQRLSHQLFSARLCDEVSFLGQQRSFERIASRADDDLDIRPTRSNGVRKIAAIHRTRHVHVGVKQSDTFVRFEMLERAVCVLSLKHLKAEGGEHVGCDPADDLFIIGEDGEAA